MCSETPSDFFRKFVDFWSKFDKPKKDGDIPALANNWGQTFWSDEFPVWNQVVFLILLYM